MSCRDPGEAPSGSCFHPVTSWSPVLRLPMQPSCPPWVLAVCTHPSLQPVSLSLQPLSSHLPAQSPEAKLSVQINKRSSQSLLLPTHPWLCMDPARCGPHAGLLWTPPATVRAPTTTTPSLIFP